MNSNSEPKLTQQLQEFVNRLRSRTPQTDILLQVRQWPTDKSEKHQLVLQVINPAFQFDVQADGENLDKVLSSLEESFSTEIGQRKALLLMMAEGIESDSPEHSLYLH